MSERQQGVRLGLFVFLMLVGLGCLVFFFGGARKWFSPQKIYFALFDEAPGLLPGSPVRKSGVRVGEVERLDLVPATGAVRVTLRINPNFTPRQSDQPTITRTLIAGESGIDFVPRNPKLEVGLPYEPGDEIAGISPINARAFIDRANDIIPEARDSMKEIRDSLRRLEEIIPEVRDTLAEYRQLGKAAREFVPQLEQTNRDAQNFLKTTTRVVDEVGGTLKTETPKAMAALQSFEKTSDQLRKLINDDNQREFNRIVRNAAEASDRLPEIARDVQKFIADARPCIDRLIEEVRQNFAPFREALQDIKAVTADVRRITRPLGDSAEKIARNLEIGTDQFARTLMDVREILRTVSKAEGTLGRFITDPSFYLNLNETALGVQRIVPRLDRILKDLEVFADKIARHPEALGVGGAVRPDSGLKEAPSIPGPAFKPRP